MKLVEHLLELLLLRPSEHLLDILVNTALITFEDQDMVSTALDNLLSDSRLGAHGIHCHQASLAV